MRKTTQEKRFDKLVREVQTRALVTAFKAREEAVRARARASIQEYRTLEWRKSYLMLSDRAHALRAVVGLPNVAARALGPLLEMVESYGALMKQDAVA